MQLDLFNQLVEHQEMKPFLSCTVKTFLHQIALTLTVLKKLHSVELKQLPIFYGYPTHLNGSIEKCNQASQMDQLQTAFLSCSHGLPNMPVSEKTASWIEDKTKRYRQSD